MWKLLMAFLVLVAGFILRYESQGRRNVSFPSSDTSANCYKAGDLVPLYADKLGSFHNPMFCDATIGLISLFPCRIAKNFVVKSFNAFVIEKKEALGDVLNGESFVSAPYKIEFLGHKDSEVVCRKKLSKEEVAQFRDAISKNYYFMMYCDDIILPIFWFIGKVDKKGKNETSDYRYYLKNHINFNITYQEDRVVGINGCPDPDALVDLTEEKEVEVEFLYSVKWKESTRWYPQHMLPMRCRQCEMGLKLAIRNVELGINTSQPNGITNKSNNDSSKTVFYLHE